MDFRSPLGHAISFCLASLLLTFISPAVAAEAISFEGKTVTIIVGTGTGGSTDGSARLMGQFLAKHLPGSPNVVVQNRPGAYSLAAMTYFAQQVKPDGFTVAVGSIGQLDPVNYRVPQSGYDPAKFVMVGGIDLGGGFLIIRNDAMPRLTDKSQPPVILGTPAGIPHSAMLPAAWGNEYLGWNVKWVPGFPSQTPALSLALQRGEVDMSGFSTSGLSGALLDRTKFTPLYQTGSEKCTKRSSVLALQTTPIFAETMKGKISNPLAQKAFDHWCTSSSVMTWMALPPGTPAPIVETYRSAFSRIAADPLFLEQAKIFSPDASAASWQRITDTVHAFAQTPAEVFEFRQQMLQRQGLEMK
jgi:hypothetical protein